MLQLLAKKVHCKIYYELFMLSNGLGKCSRGLGFEIFRSKTGILQNLKAALMRHFERLFLSFHIFKQSAIYYSTILYKL